jgi:hypothetical protein
MMKTSTFVSTLALAVTVLASPMKNMTVANPLDWQLAPQGMRIIPKLADQPYGTLQTVTFNSTDFSIELSMVLAVVKYFMVPTISEQVT